MYSSRRSSTSSTTRSTNVSNRSSLMQTVTLDSIYEAAQNVVSQIPMLMSDDEVVDSHYEQPSSEAKKSGARMPGQGDFSSPSPSRTPHPKPQDMADRIMTEEIPLTNRDTNGLNSSLEVHFLDVFGEPEPTLHSVDCLWVNSYRVFEITRLWAYRILSLIFGLPAAFLCGLCYGCISFNFIWCFHPLRRLFLIKYGMIRQIVYGLCGLTVRPLFLAIGSVFSNIRVHQSNGQHIPEEQLLIV